MKSKRKDTIKQRVTSRFKGLGAIMLALFMILTGMSLMPPVEAEAATGDQYWIIGYNNFRDLLFCTGQESSDISGNVYEVLSRINDWNNGYVTDDEFGYVKLSNGSPLTSLGTLSNSGLEITISPEEDTYVNAGCVHSYEGSGMLFQMKVDGTVKAETTGLGEEGKARFLLDAGKYAVTYSYERLEGTGIRYKFIVDFESVIDSLTVTPADATLTFGGSTQTLTVSPASVADKVEWSSEDTKIATVDSDGTVTPVSAGTVTIKATYTPEEGDPIVGTCKVTVNKAESTVAKKPTANNLTYNGKAQELVIAGTADGGTMQYALGTDEKTEPTTGWSDKVPSNTEAGTYYVWYKVVGDENHTDTEPKVVKVTIDAAQGETEIKTEVKTDEKSPKLETSDLTKEVAESTLTDKEKAIIDESVNDGKDVNVDVYLAIHDIADEITAEDKAKLEAEASDAGQLAYFDISLLKEIIVDGSSRGATRVHELQKPLKLTIGVPNSFPAVESGYTRTYVVLRLHNGEVTTLPATVNADGTISFETDRFSVYALVYKDTKDATTTEATTATATEVTTETTTAAASTSDATTAAATTEAAKTSPKTGDSMPIAVLVALMLTAAGMLVFMDLKKKKN